MERPLVVWNRQRGIQNARDPNLRSKLLLWNGFRTSAAVKQQSNCFLQKYEVYVCGLDVAALYRNGIKQKITPNDPLQRRMLREAVRASYCLGLTISCVGFNYVGGGAIVIDNVDPAPEISDKQVRHRIKKMLKEQEKKRSLNREGAAQPMFGADIEFLICSRQGRLISAERLLPRQGRAGADAIYYRDRVVYPVAELRPEPAEDARRLFEQLIQVMQLAEVRMPRTDFVWLSGGMPKQGYPLGGHLHFSGIELDIELLRVLDNYLLLPLALSESDQSRQRRSRYGNPGDVRKKSYGFEYRSLPSWILSPDLAKGVLALTELIAKHYLDFNMRPMLREPVARAFASGNKTLLRKIVNRLWEDISQVDGYPKLKADLEPFMKQLLNQEEWEDGRDIRTGWKSVLSAAKHVPQ